jgi:hypothetical protein
LIEFLPQATEVDEQALASLWEKGCNAWKDVKSAAGWVESLRGNHCMIQVSHDPSFPISFADHPALPGKPNSHVDFNHRGDSREAPGKKGPPVGEPWMKHLGAL